jgi:hypothetical protein
VLRVAEHGVCADRLLTASGTAHGNWTLDMTVLRHRSGWASAGSDAPLGAVLSFDDFGSTVERSGGCHPFCSVHVSLLVLQP